MLCPLFVFAVPLQSGSRYDMQKDGFVTKRHNELRGLEVEMLQMVCNGVEIEPVLQDIKN